MGNEQISERIRFRAKEREIEPRQSDCILCHATNVMIWVGLTTTLSKRTPLMQRVVFSDRWYPE